MHSVNIFCFGFGQVAKNFIKKIQSENIKVNLSTTSTGETCKKNINGIDYDNFFSRTSLMMIILLKTSKKQTIF